MHVPTAAAFAGVTRPHREANHRASTTELSDEFLLTPRAVDPANGRASVASLLFPGAGEGCTRRRNVARVVDIMKPAAWTSANVKLVSWLARWAGGT